MPPSTSEALMGDPIVQFTVFADNKVGRLHDLLLELSRNDLHVLALSLVDSTECTLIRVIVDYPENTRQLLRDRHLPFSESEILAVEIETEASIRSVTAALVEAEINIQYAYPFLKRPNGACALVLHLEDPELSETVLRGKGFKILRQSDLAR